MPANLVRIRISTGGKLPTGVQGFPEADSHKTAGRYESTMFVTGAVSGSYRLSIFPDDMNVKGRIKDGVYPIFLGFHDPKKPKQSDLEVRTNGFRPVIVFNANMAVPVESLNPEKTTSTEIHIHNGWYGWKAGMSMSEGCLLVHPDDWSKFIGSFLKAYPNLSEWSVNGRWIGQAIGFATVTT
jgi:hypothetical protein